MPNTNTPILLLRPTSIGRTISNTSGIKTFVLSRNRAQSRMRNYGRNIKPPYRLPSLIQTARAGNDILIDEAPYLPLQLKNILKQLSHQILRAQDRDYAINLVYNNEKDKARRSLRIKDLYEDARNGNYLDQDMIIQDENDRIAVQVANNMRDEEAEKLTLDLQDQLMDQGYRDWLKQEHPGIDHYNPLLYAYWKYVVGGGRDAANNLWANHLQANRDGIGGRYESSDIASNVVNYELQYQDAVKRGNDIYNELQLLGYGYVSQKTQQLIQRIEQLLDLQKQVSAEQDKLRPAHNYYMQTYLKGDRYGHSGLVGRAMEDASEWVDMFSHLGSTDQSIAARYEKESRKLYEQWKQRDPKLSYDDYLHRQALNVKKHAEYAKKIYKADYDEADNELIDFKNRHNISQWYKLGEQLHQNDSLASLDYWFYVQPGMAGTSSDSNQLIAHAIKAAGIVAGTGIGAATGGIGGAAAGAAIGWNVSNVLAMPSELSAGYNENYMEALLKRADNMKVLMSLPENGGIDGYQTVLGDLRDKYALYLKKVGASDEYILEATNDENLVLQAAALGQITSNHPVYRKAYVESMKGLEDLRQRDNVRTMYGEWAMMPFNMLPVGGKLRNAVGAAIRNKIIDKTAVGRAVTGLYDAAKEKASDKVGKFLKDIGIKNVLGYLSKELAEQIGANDFAKERIYSHTLGGEIKKHVARHQTLAAITGTGVAGQVVAAATGTVTGTAATLAHNMYGYIGRRFYRDATGVLIRNNSAAAKALKWLAGAGKKVANSNLARLGLPIAKVALINGVQEGNEEGVQYLNSKYDIANANWDAPDPTNFHDMILAFWDDSKLGLRVGLAYLSLLGIGDSPLKNDLEFWNNVKGGFSLGLGMPVVARTVDTIHNAIVENNIAEKFGLDGLANREGAKLDRKSNTEFSRLAARGHEQAVADTIKRYWKVDRERGKMRNYSDEEWQDKLDDARRTMALTKDAQIRSNLEKVGIKYNTEEYHTAIGLLSDAYKQIHDNQQAVSRLDGDFKSMISNGTVTKAIETRANQIFESLLGSDSYKENREKSIKLARENDPHISKEEAGKQYDNRLRAAVTNATRTSVQESYKILAIANAIKNGNTAKLYLLHLKDDFGIQVDAHDAPTMMRSLRRLLTTAIELANERIGKTGEHFSEKGDIDTLIDLARKKIEKVTEVDNDAIHNGSASAMLTAHNTLYSNFVKLLSKEASLRDIKQIRDKEAKQDEKEKRKQEKKKASLDVTDPDYMPEFSDGAHRTERDVLRGIQYRMDNSGNYHEGRFKSLVSKYIQVQKENDGLTALAGDYMDGSLNDDSSSKLDTAYTKERQADLDVEEIEQQNNDKAAKEQFEHNLIKAHVDRILHRKSRPKTDSTDNTTSEPKEQQLSRNKQMREARRKAKEKRTKRNGKEKVVDKLLLKHSYTPDELYDVLVEHTSNPFEKSLLKSVVTVAQKLGLTIRFGETKSNKHYGSYSKGSINISFEASLKKNQDDLVHVVLHELIHGVTAYVIDANLRGTLKSSELKKAADKLQKIYEFAKKDKYLQKNFKYAISDIYEFVAEFANPKFRDALRGIKEKSDTYGLWDRIKDAIRRIVFNYVYKISDTLKNSLDDILEWYDEDEFNNYRTSSTDVHYLDLNDFDKRYVDVTIKNKLREAVRDDKPLTFPKLLEKIQDDFDGYFEATLRVITIGDIITKAADEYQAARNKFSGILTSDDNVITLYIDAFREAEEPHSDKKVDKAMDDTKDVREGNPILELLDAMAAKIDKEHSSFGCILVVDDDGQTTPYPNVDFIHSLQDEKILSPQHEAEKDLFDYLVNSDTLDYELLKLAMRHFKINLDQVPAIKFVVDLGLYNNPDWAYYAVALLDKVIGRSTAVKIAAQVRDLALSAVLGEEITDFSAYPAGAQTLYEQFKHNKIVDQNGKTVLTEFIRKFVEQGNIVLDTRMPIYGQTFPDKSGNRQNRCVYIDLAYSNADGTSMGFYDITTSYRNLANEKSRKGHYIEISGTPEWNRHRMVHEVEEIITNIFGPIIEDLGYIPIHKDDAGGAVSRYLNIYIALADDRTPIYRVNHSDEYLQAENAGTINGERNSIIQISGRILLRVKDIVAMYGDAVNTIQDYAAKELDRLSKAADNILNDSNNKGKVADLKSVVNELVLLEQNVIDTEATLYKHYKDVHTADGTIDNYNYKKTDDLSEEDLLNAQTEEGDLFEACRDLDVAFDLIPDFPAANVKTNAWLRFIDSVAKVQRIFDAIIVQYGKQTKAEGDPIIVVNGVALPNIDVLNKYRNEAILLQTAYHTILANRNPAIAANVFRTMGTSEMPSTLLGNLITANEYMQSIIQGVTEYTPDRYILMYYNIANGYARFVQRVADKVLSSGAQIDPALVSSVRDQIDKANLLIDEVNVTFVLSSSGQFSGEGDLKTNELAAIRNILTKRRSARKRNEKLYATEAVHPSYMEMRKNPIYGALTNDGDITKRIAGSQVANAQTSIDDDRAVIISLVKRNTGKDTEILKLRYGDNFLNVAIRLSFKDPNTGDTHTLDIPFYNVINEYSDISDAAKQQLTVENAANVRFIQKVAKALDYVKTYNGSKITFKVNFQTQGLHYPLKYRSARGKNVQEFLFKDDLNNHDLYSIIASKESGFGWLLYKEGSTEYRVVTYNPTSKNTETLFYARDKAFRRNTNEGDWHNGYAIYRYKLGEGKDQHVDTALSVARLGELGVDPNNPGQNVARDVTNLIIRYLNGERDADGYNIERLLRMCLLFRNPNGDYGKMYSDKQWKDHWVYTTYDANGKMYICFGKNKLFSADQPNEIYEEVANTPMFRNMPLSNFYLRLIPMSENTISTLDPIFLRMLSELEPGQSITLPNGLTFDYEDFHHKDEDGDEVGTTMLGWMLRNNILTSKAEGKSERQMNITDFDITFEESGDSKNAGDITSDPSVVNPEESEEEDEGYEEPYLFELADKKHSHTDRTELQKAEFKLRVERIAEKLLGENANVTFSNDMKKDCKEKLKYFAGIGALRREILGVAMTSGIMMSYYAPDSTIYHECFHRLVELVFDDKERESLYKIIRGNNSNISDRDVAETLADMYQEWMEGLNSVNTAKRFGKVKAVFGVLNIIKNMAKNLGVINAIKVLRTYGKVNSGKYRNREIAEERVKRFNEKFSGALFQKITNPDNGATHDFKSLYSMEDVNDALDGITAIITNKIFNNGIARTNTIRITWQNICDIIGDENISRMCRYKITHNAEDDVLTDKIIGYKNGKPVYHTIKKYVVTSKVPNDKVDRKTEFLREFFGEYWKRKHDEVDDFDVKGRDADDNIIYGTKTVSSVNPAFDAMLKMLANKIDAQLKGGYSHDAYDNDEIDDAAKDNPEKYDRVAYEESKLKNATALAKLFVSTFPAQRYTGEMKQGEDGKMLRAKTALTNDMGFQILRTPKEVTNILYEKTKDCRTAQEMIDLLKDLAKRSNETIFEIAYYRLQKLYDKAYPEKTDHNLNVDYDAELILASVFQLLTGQTLDFLVARSTSNKDRSRSITIRHAGRDRNRINTAKNWRLALLSGATGVIEQQHTRSGDVVFTKSGGLIHNEAGTDMFKRTIKKLKTIAKQLTSERDTLVNDTLKLQNGKNADGSIHYDEYPLGDVNAVHKLYQVVANTLMRIGITVSADMLEYVAENDKLLQGSTYADKLGSLLTIQRDKISANAFYDVIDGFSTDDGIIIADNIREAYVTNGFIKYLANWFSEYSASVTDRMVSGLDGKRLFTGSQNSCLSDELTFLCLGAVKDNEYINTVLNPDQKYTMFKCQDGVIGSIMAKLVYNYRTAKNKSLVLLPTFRLGILHGFRGDRLSDNGKKYNEYSPLQDYMARFQAMLQGYMVFPTPSDKSTYAFISGVDLPGIKYNTGMGFREALSGFSTYEIRDGKVRMKIPDEVLNQMYEYAVTEHNQIVKTIADLKTMKEEDKVLNYHIPGKGCKYANGTRFISFSSVLLPDAIYPNKRVRIYFNNQNANSEDMLKLADYAFFNIDGTNLDSDGYVVNKVPTAAQKRILEDTLEANVDKELERLIDMGVIGRLEPESGLNDAERNTQFGFVNILLNKATIESISRLYTNTEAIRKGLVNNAHVSKSLQQQATSENGFSNVKTSLAIKALVADGVFKSIMSTQEAFRLFIGNPAFFEIKYGDDDLMKSYSVDMSKRIGGLMSTGDENMIDESNDTYTCAIINDTKHKSRSAAAKTEANGKSYIENEFIRLARVNTLRRHLMNDSITAFISEYLPDLDMSELSDQVKDVVSDKIYELITEDDGTTINNEKLDKLAAQFGLSYRISKAEKTASDYAKSLTDSDTNVTDGSAFISLDFAERLLRMRGAYNKDYEKLFSILRSTKNEDIAKSAEAYKLIHRALNPVNIVATKYTAYGMRSAADGTVVPYYNKYALYVVTPGMLYGKLGKIYLLMQDQKVDMIMEASAVKVGTQGAVNVNDDGSFDKPLNVFTQNISLLRRQLNTDPGDKDERALGSLALKVAMSLIDRNETYIDKSGNEIRGHQLLDRLMETINKLSDKGFDKIKERLCDKNGNISEEKLSKFLLENLSARDASANLLQQFELVTGADGSKHMRGPIQSSSNLAWIANILKSVIIKNVVDVVTPGTSFVQRSVFSMQGENAIDPNTGLKLYNGNPLLMFDKDKKCMDCAISIDYFRSIIPKDITTFEDARLWLIDNNYIGQNAEADTIGYRIPTQAVSSIHALRIADVVDVVKDTIILPEEFTTITGSDFDIDHLYLATKWKDTKGDETKELLNLLVDDMLTLLQSSDKFFITQYRSIDNDTSPIKAIADMIPDDDSDTNDAFSFDQLSTQVDKRNQFITGKVGIGPFALNVTLHVLSMLYDVRLHPDAFTLQCGVDRANRMYDDDDIEVMSWLSGFINAHVDIVKDPYISKLNVNSYTYNLIALLTRSGYGKLSLMFTASPLMKLLAKANISAGDQLRLGKMDSAAKERNKSAIRLINKLFGLEISLTSSDDANDSLRESLGYINEKDFMARQGAAAHYIMTYPSLLEWVIKHPKVAIDSDVEIPVTIYGYSIVDLAGDPITVKKFNQYIYLANIGFQQEGAKLSNLIHHTKVDTRKYGKDLIEQIKYLYEYEKMRSTKNVYDNLDSYLDDTWIDKKTHNAIDSILRILNKQDLTATNMYRYIILHMVEDGVNTKLITELVLNLQTEQIAPYFVLFAASLSSNGNASEYISSLFGGLLSIVNLFSSILFRMNTTELGYEKYKHLRNNYLIQHLTYQEDNSELREYEGYLFLSLRQDVDEDTMNQDLFTKAWEQLLLDENKDIRDFAKGLIVYAFFTSGMSTKWNTLFKYVPTSWKDGTNVDDPQLLPKKTQNGIETIQTYNNYVRDLIDNCNTGYPEGYLTKDMIKRACDTSTDPGDRNNKLLQLLLLQNRAEALYNELLAQAARQIDTYGVIPRVRTSTKDYSTGKTTTDYLPSARTDMHDAATYIVSVHNAYDKEGKLKDVPNLIYVTDKSAEGLYQKSGLIKTAKGSYWMYTLLPLTGFDDGHNRIYQYGYTLTNGQGLVYQYNGPEHFILKPQSGIDTFKNTPYGLISSLDDIIKRIYQLDETEDASAQSNKQNDSQEHSGDRMKAEKSAGNIGYASDKWTRQSASDDKHTLYIFTDNTDRTSGVSNTANGGTTQIDPNSKYAKLFITDTKPHGYGSEKNPTTAIIRGLDNAMPISTMKHFGPFSEVANNRWTNDDFKEYMKVITKEINAIKREWDTGKYDRILLPKGGLFYTKIANMSPNTLMGQYLQAMIDDLIKYVNTGGRNRVFVDSDKVAKQTANTYWQFANKKISKPGVLSGIFELTDKRTLKQKGAQISLSIEFKRDVLDKIDRLGVNTTEDAMLKALTAFLNVYCEYINTGNLEAQANVRRMISSEKNGGIVLRAMFGLARNAADYNTDDGFKEAITHILNLEGDPIVVLTVVDHVDDIKLTLEEQKRADDAQKQCN